MSSAIGSTACGPCPTPKQVKLKNEQDLREIKIAINYLTGSHMYDHETTIVLGRLVARLVQLQGPLR